MKNFYDGQWVEASKGESWISRSPADQTKVLGEFTEDVGAIDAAIAAARRAQTSWGQLSLDDRREALGRFKAALLERVDAIGNIIAMEMGKPLWEALGEARALAGKIDVTLDTSMPLVAGKLLGGGSWIDGGYRYQALGVCAVLGPFNFPLHLANGHIIAALASGNTVVFKPSEKTPACAQLYAEAVAAAGFPPGVLNIVQGRRAAGEALVASDDVNAVLFTGSVQVGLAIRRATVEQPWKLLALEMGGKNTAIVLDDADLDRAAYEIGIGAMLTTGQRCSGTSRVIVAESLYAGLVERLERIWDGVKVGHPLAADTFMGPLIDGGAVRRFIAAADSAEAEDMECLRRNRSVSVSGDDGPYKGFYVGPALWRATRRPRKGDIHDLDEIFGPDVVLHTVSGGDLDEIAELANATQYGLAMGVFTASESKFRALAGRLRAGIINFNRGTVGASGLLPFGGVKMSGNHRPAALLAPHYCTYPVATLRQPHDLADDAIMARFPTFR